MRNKLDAQMTVGKSSSRCDIGTLIVVGALNSRDGLLPMSGSAAKVHVIFVVISFPSSMGLEVEARNGSSLRPLF